MEKYFVVLIICIICVFFAVNNGLFFAESFANNTEKKQSILDWFNNNDSKSYTKYRSDLDGKSNIVEYEDAMNLFYDKNLTMTSLDTVVI